MLYFCKYFKGTGHNATFIINNLAKIAQSHMESLFLWNVTFETFNCWNLSNNIVSESVRRVSSRCVKCIWISPNKTAFQRKSVRKKKTHEFFWYSLRVVISPYRNKITDKCPILSYLPAHMCYVTFVLRCSKWNRWTSSKKYFRFTIIVGHTKSHTKLKMW